MKNRGYADTFFIHEELIRIHEKQRYRQKAVDQDGVVVDMFLDKRGDGHAAKCFSKRLLPKRKGEPRKIVTDKLGSCNVAHKELIPIRFTTRRTMPTIGPSCRTSL